MSWHRLTVPGYTESAVSHDIAGDHGVWAKVAAAVGRRPRVVSSPSR